MPLVLILFIFLSFFWFIREVKFIFFWLYLWQLKEYHFGRFFAHFSMSKGKKIFLNLNYAIKIALLGYALVLYFYHHLLAWQFYVIWPTVLAIIYFFESGKFIFDLFKKNIKKPVFTKKTLFLTSISLIFAALFFYVAAKEIKLFYWFSFALLLFDILTPIIISGIVLLLQPLTIFQRKKIIKKAREKREKLKNLLVIGITGSYGKTSTKEFLATILAKKFNVLKTKEHQNSEMGISQCILNELNENHEIFVVEMGAYNRGGIKLLCDITKPHIGILTGINEQHVATYGSLDKIIQTKFELIESLPEEGFAILNGDNELIMAYIKNQKSKQNTKSKIFCSIKEKMNIWAEKIKIEKEKISFRAVSDIGDKADFKLNLFGAQNVINILLAAGCAKKLGLTLKEISNACKKIELWRGGIELKKGANGVNIINATYSANPDSVISHLEYLKFWPNKKIIVMPCLIELGKASKEVHRKIGRKIAEVCDLAIITTKDRFKEIKEGAGQKAMFLEKPEEIIEKIKNFCQPKDIVLLEGRLPKQLIKSIAG